MFFDNKGIIYHKKDEGIFTRCYEKVGDPISKTMIRLKINNQVWKGIYKTYIIAHLFVKNPNPDTYKWVEMIDKEGEIVPSNLKWVATRVLHNPGWKQSVFVYFQDNSVKEFESMKKAGVELGIDPQIISKKARLGRMHKGLLFSKKPIDVEKARELINASKRQQSPQVF